MTDLRSGTQEYMSIVNSFEDSFLYSISDFHHKVTSVKRITNDGITRRFSMWRNDLLMNVSASEKLEWQG